MLRRQKRSKQKLIMPVLSKFYGIVIRMLLAFPNEAHFHASYGNAELVVGIAPLRIIQGDAPFRVRALVLHWAARHQEDLLAAWCRCLAHQRPAPIQPLP